MSQGVKPIKHSNCTGVSPALRIHLLRLADSKQATDWGPPRQSDACDALKQPRQCNPICPPKSGVVPPWVPLETRKKKNRPHTHSRPPGWCRDAWQETEKDKTEPTIIQQKPFFSFSFML